MAHEALPPAHARPQEQGLAAGKELHDLHILHPERLGNENGGLVHQGGEVGALQRALTEFNDRCPLGCTDSQCLLCPLALGDLCLGLVVEARVVDG